MPIVVVGTVFVDIKGFPEDLYIPGGRNAGSVQFVHGGVGRNVAEDIANVELRPVFVSMVDDSAQGEAVLEKLRKHRVNTDYIVKADNGMGMWLAVFDETGDVVGSISKRPDMGPMAELLDEKGDEIFSAADSVVVEVDLDREVVKRVLRLARKYGKKVFAVVANMSIATQRRDQLQDIDCIICNVQEAGILFVDDFEGLSPEEMREALSKHLMNAAFPAMVVTMGSQGSVYADRFGMSGVQPAGNVVVRDTTGAGDAFCAGVTIGLTYGKSMPEAVLIGTKLASSVITVAENVCPRFRPREFGLDIVPED